MNLNPLNLIPSGWRILLIGLAVAMLVGAIYAKGWAAGAADVRGKWDKAVIAQHEANDKLEEAWSAHVISAENERTKHEKELATARAAAANAAERLRISTAGYWRGLSESTADACRTSAAAAAELLNECSGKYRELASAADGHVADIQQCESAWPVIEK